MATIASLAVQIVADPSKAVAGLKVFETSVQRIGKSALNPGVWAKMSGQAVNKVQAMVDGIIGPVKHLIGMIPLVGDSLSSIPTSLGSLAQWFKEGSSRIKDMQRTAMKLGIEIEKMSGLMLAAGPASDSMAMSMLRLQKELGEAAMKAEGTEITFARLGLNAKELTRLPLDAALGKIADKINLLDNQSAKGVAVFSIFGKRGAELMPLLARGSVGLEMFQRKAREMGLAVSAIDAEKVRSASLAMKRLNLWMDAAKQSVAVELAPYVLALSEHFSKAGISARDFGKSTVTVLRGIAKGSAYVIDVVKGIGLTAQTIAIGFKVIGATVHGSIIGLLEIASKLPERLGGNYFKGAADEMKRDFDKKSVELEADAQNIRNAWKDLFRNPSVTGVDAFFHDVEKKAEEARKALGSEVDHDFSRQVELWERAQKVMQEVASPVEKFADRMKELNELVNEGAIKWDTWSRAAGRAIMEAHKPDEFMLGTETVIEKFANRLDELNQLLDAGAIKWETYERAVFDAGRSIVDLHKAEGLRMAGSAEFGSQEAFKTINQTLMNAGGKQSGLEQLKHAMKEQLALQKQQKKDLDEIANAARRGFLAMGRI